MIYEVIDNVRKKFDRYRYRSVLFRPIRVKLPSMNCRTRSEDFVDVGSVFG